jgi:anaerobic selenocysteine-containing dehydrogenase
VVEDGRFTRLEPDPAHPTGQALCSKGETPEGSVRARAHFNNRIDPRVVVGEHGWWQACAELDAPGYDPFGPTGANLNLIIGGAVLDPVSGTASHRAYLCEIRRGA